MGFQKLPVTEPLRNPPPVIRVDRGRLEPLIANAIELLDQIDGDPDLEPDDHESCEAFDDGMYPFL